MWIKVLSKPCLQFKIAGEVENNSKLQIWRQALQVGGLKFLHPA